MRPTPRISSTQRHPPWRSPASLPVLSWRGVRVGRLSGAGINIIGSQRLTGDEGPASRCDKALSGSLIMRPAAVNFTAPCKSAPVATVVLDDPSRIERGLARGFLLAKISESRFLSSRRRSNIVPRATVIGRPSPLARQRRCHLSQDKCKASSACPSTSG